MKKEDEKFSDSLVMEGMNSIRSVFEGYKNGTNNRTIQKILIAKSKEEKLKKEIGWLKHRSEEFVFPIDIVPDSEIDSLSIGNSHGGILAYCSERTFPLLQSIGNLKKDGFYVMIEGIEDPYNFGYAMRSLYAAGVDGIILDERNWMSAAGIVARSSAGASELFQIYTSNASDAVDFFHKNSYQVVCADLDTPYTLEDTKIPFPVFLIVGGERRGISRNILDACDLKVKISYGREFKASLSAASAATILAYEIWRQNK